MEKGEGLRTSDCVYLYTQLQTMKGNLIVTQEDQSALENSIRVLDNTLLALRTIADHFMQEEMELMTLDASLEELFGKFRLTTGVTLNYYSSGLEKIRLHQPMAATLYRMVESLLYQSLDIPKAGNLTVVVQREKIGFRIRLEDDGNGLDNMLPNREAGINWENLRNTIQSLNGDLKINSREGEGSSVYISFKM